MTSSSRRRLLTGGVALDALRARGEEVATALESSEPLPFAGDTLRLETQGMACSWAVVLDPGAPDRALIASEALQEVQRIERWLSVYRSDSPVSQLNRSAAEAPQPIDTELCDLLALCDTLYTETAGAFDPATQGLITLWRDCRQAGRIPSSFEIEAALQTSGWGRVELHRTAGTTNVDHAEPAGGVLHFTTAGVGLNFGAIGKGYAVDQVLGHLRDAGIADCLVHGGYSSVRVSGEHYGQGGWPVGLKNPLFTEESYLLLLLKDQALGTSGSNIQFFRHGGKRYGHILDPRTGWPADRLLSVSVIAPTAAEADALSTAFYVLGLEKALEYCHTHPRVGAILTPPAEQGRGLSPVVCNLPADRVFRTSDAVDLRWSSARSDPDDHRAG